MVFDISQSSTSRTVRVSDIGEVGEQDTPIAERSHHDDEINPGSTFIVCAYDTKWWIGIVKDKSDEFEDYLVSFMNPSGEAKQYFWPEREDTCWVEKTNIICTIHSPAITSSSTRGYAFLSQDLKRAKDLFIQKFQHK